MNKENLLKLKNFLNQPEILDLLYKKNFEEMYKKLHKECVGKITGTFTQICLKKNINPLLYMNYIPGEFLCESEIKKFKIPNNVKRIEDDLFNGAFYECKLLTNIEIPNSVTSIGDRAFFGCEQLPNIVIPQSTTSIGNGAFKNCQALTNVTFESDSQVTSIGTDAFYKCASLTNITIPNSVTKIGSYAFEACTSLERVIIGDGVTHIEGATFRFNKSLAEVTIGKSVLDIGQCAFYCCESLENITIPYSVTNISFGAFGYCHSLNNINFEGTRAQWTRVSKDPKWCEGVPAEVVHCKDGDMKI